MRYEELPIADRATLLREAVKNGYRDIKTIKEVYNSYSEGGEINNTTTIGQQNQANEIDFRTHALQLLQQDPLNIISNNDFRTQLVESGNKDIIDQAYNIMRKNLTSYGYPPIQNTYGDGGGIIDNIKQTVKQRIANNIYPYGYEDYNKDNDKYIGPIGKIFNSVVLNKKSDQRKEIDDSINNNTALYKDKTRLALLSKYLDTPIEGIDNNKYLIESKYKPTLSNNKNTKYYTINPELHSSVKDFMDNQAFNYTIGHGSDDKGNYISVYDYWDMNPLSGSGGKDESFGMGNPIELYDRIYESENPNEYEYLKMGYDNAINKGYGTKNGNILDRHWEFKDGGFMNNKNENKENVENSNNTKSLFDSYLPEINKNTKWYYKGDDEY